MNETKGPIAELTAEAGPFCKNVRDTLDAFSQRAEAAIREAIESGHEADEAEDLAGRIRRAWLRGPGGHGTENVYGL